MSSAPRRPRRAVRPSSSVGTDESVLHARLPALPSATSPPRAAAARHASADAPDAGAPDVAGAGGVAEASGGPGPTAAGVTVDDLWRATRSADDSDRGWGREEPSSNDERLRREKPPHW
ncbi:hypothetical protein [Cellulomonas dongxiuzhuiae]|uniref:Uncharacterized protein n=1 Tax=Cellulomonas dongxiuzhuiae TaxID=2819979 RepID=A0ABX8GKY5_9CELL|nr:hypothetical protein [Cellulomonas dongxiuzhuiae]MBO3088872.1 hypothetical protein [Cellulomonas dongxiuzhuiae]MBO3096431.1 hypothetical protein [Cellulomonas dongxiuzhuiae]QWC16838.1 hypothetical protein KKR89_04145 [Cellulomonas dongxiuzhuiae]